MWTYIRELKKNIILPNKHIQENITAITEKGILYI